jgi:hypothetical protein
MRHSPEYAHRRRLVAMRDTSPSVWWWLSFCDPKKAAGSQFLGVAIVKGNNILNASQEAWNLGCNPGGEVCGDVFEANEVLAPERFRNRLLTASEIEECESERVSLARKAMN